MPTTYTIIAYYCWIVLFAIWFIGQFGNKKTLEQPQIGLYLVTTLLIGAGFMFLFWQRAFNALNVQLTPQTAIFGIIGVALTAISVLFAIWARFSLGRNWSGNTATVKQDHALITSGPYRLVRHPIYTGFIFGMLGTALTIGTTTAYLGVVLFCVAAAIRMQIEEKVMETKFPKDYPAYKKTSKRIVPWVY